VSINPHIMNQFRLWDRFESRVLEITCCALQLMRTATSLPDDEKELNQLLARYIREAMWMLRASDTGFDHAPHLDASNQPDLDDAIPATREHKRPDFQWELKDSRARARDEYQRFYAIECKRLGLPTSATWVLNEQYVTNGIRRFTRREDCYGSPRSNRSASMIGYIQSMDHASILDEVNYFCRVSSIAQMRLSPFGWRNHLSYLDQVVQRPEIHPLPLLLRHLWLDLRSIPLTTSKPAKQSKRKRTKR
jgi:hypothetical protein